MKEYGGYLSLELSDIGDYFAPYADYTVKLQSGRAALKYILECEKVEKLFLPRYLCPHVAEYVKEYVRIEYYGIDGNFNPQGVKLGDKDYLFWVNFFGLASVSQQENILRKYERVIFDNTQAFYAKPYIQAYNIYSCRKFFGVADGAYLIKKGISKISLKKNYGYETGGFLLKSLELGTNEAYKDYQDNESIFNVKELREMSLLTNRIMQSIDHVKIKSIRRENFNIIHEQLGQWNELCLNLSDEMVPMTYPLLLVNDLAREYLIQNKVYVSQWWKAILENKESNTFEKRLSKYLLPLPIDQRYRKEDMLYICKIIRAHILRL